MKRRKTTAARVAPFYCCQAGCSRLAAVRGDQRAYCRDHIPHDWPNPLPMWAERQPAPDRHVHGADPDR